MVWKHNSVTAGPEAGGFLSLAGEPAWQKGSVRDHASKMEGEKLKTLISGLHTCVHTHMEIHLAHSNGGSVAEGGMGLRQHCWL